jgi:hypothetical protein
MQILLALAAVAAQAEPVWILPPLATFEKNPLLYGDRVRVEVEILPSPKAGPRQYTFKRVFVGRNGEDEGQPYYTDTIYCPLALRSLQQLTDLPGPQPGIEGMEKGPAEGSIRDGVAYRLSVATTPPYSFGDMTLRSNTGTPLAQWVDEALKTLKPCWRPTQLKL